MRFEGRLAGLAVPEIGNKTVGNVYRPFVDKGR